MALFGSFETEREVYSDPIYTVYRARKAGETQADYAVKVFSLERLDFEAETAAELGPLLSDIERTRVEGIRAQEKAAAASAFVAPVFETGRDERGVWYATRYYPRSVNRIITGKVALPGDSLHHILRSIAQGALGLKRACGRSHGDIQPSNVQIGAGEKLSKVEIALSDPLPGGEQEAARYELSDLRSIGQILLQLVRQRAIGNDKDFLILPILESPEWTRACGKDTGRWLSLCNRLLDPELSLDRLTLEQLVAELDQLQPKPPVSPKLLMGVAAALVVAGVSVALGYYFMHRPRSQRVEITSDPPGATVFVDQHEVSGAELQNLKLAAGSHTIEARHEALRLLEQSTNLVVLGGAPLQIHFQFPYGSVAITGEPRGATILRDGVAIGKMPADGSPFIVSNVAAGVEVGFELTADGYVSQKINGMVVKGKRLELNKSLQKTEDTEWVEIESSPQSARVLWQGSVVISATPDRARLPRGSQTLTLAYRDWPPQTVTVEVRKGVSISTNYDFPKGRVALDSDPPGATVWIGTNHIDNVTPTTVWRPAGQTTFRFELAGFETTNLTVMLADKSTSSLKPVMLSDNGVFELSAEPSGASVLDGSGKIVGTISSGNPLKVLRAPGTYAFTARVEGLSDVTTSLTVSKREIKKHTFAFDYGTVRLESVPPGAAIAADGKVLGFAPKTLVQKPGIKVTYQVVAPDYLPATNEVTLQSGERERPVLVRLVPEPVSVALASDPPGAQFYFGGSALLADRAAYWMPWGTNSVTARHPLYPWLEEVTENVIVRKAAANSREFKFNYGTVAFETVPPDADAQIFERSVALARTPTNLFVRPGRVAYEVIYEDQTNHVATNVIMGAVHRFLSTFEVRRDYTNSVGMVLVRTKEGFYVGKFEVTQEQYRQVMGVAFEGRPLQPVVNVNWANAMGFCQKLSQSDTASLAKARIPGWSYALPTETEWARFAGNEAAELTEAVFGHMEGPLDIDPLRKSSNRAGLYDLFGNVAEWCLGASQQPITIGGSFANRKPRQIPEDLLRITDAKMLGSSITDGSPSIGLRCVLKPPRP